MVIFIGGGCILSDNLFFCLWSTTG